MLKIFICASALMLFGAADSNGAPPCHGDRCHRGDGHHGRHHEWRARHQAAVDALVATFDAATQQKVKIVLAAADQRFPHPARGAGHPPHHQDWAAHHQAREKHRAERQAFIIAQLDAQNLQAVSAAFRGLWAAWEKEREARRAEWAQRGPHHRGPHHGPHGAAAPAARR